MRRSGSGPIRVLHLVATAEAADHLELFVQHCDRQRVETTIGSVDSPGRLQAAMQRQGVSTFSLGADSRAAYPRAVARLARVLRARRIDVVQTHLLDATIVGLAAARAARVPVGIFTAHHSSEIPLHDRRTLSAVDRLAARGLADRVIAPSATMRDVLVGYHGVPFERIAVVHHGVDFGRFHASRVDGHEFREEHRLGSGPVFVAVSRHFWMKNLMALVEAFAVVAVRDAELRLVVAGYGDPAPLGRRVRELGLDSRVTVLGHVDAPETVMAAGDVLVHSSLTESFGMVILEAMAMGRPVVSTPVGIAPELVESGVTGILSADTTVPALVRAMADMLELRPRWDEMGQTGHERASGFTPLRWVRAHEDLYERWLEESRR